MIGGNLDFGMESWEIYNQSDSIKEFSIWARVQTYFQAYFWARDQAYFWAKFSTYLLPHFQAHFWVHFLAHFWAYFWAHFQAHFCL